MAASDASLVPYPEWTSTLWPPYVSLRKPTTSVCLAETAFASPAVDIPGYEVLRELGRGGMGVVYQARQTGLNRLVALKMILAGPHGGEQELERFRAEAEIIARLQHPNIIQIHEVGQ